MHGLGLRNRTSSIATQEASYLSEYVVKIPGRTPTYSDIQALQKYDIGRRLVPAPHARDDYDLPRETMLFERVRQLEQVYSSDDMEKPSPVPSALAYQASMHLIAQRRYDKDVALDQVGSRDFTERRFKRLSSISGAQAIAVQYGQSFAAEFNDQPFYPRLKIANEVEVSYHRGWPWGGLQERLTALYTQKHGPLPKGHDVVFVNSSRAVCDFQLLLESTMFRGMRPPTAPPQVLGRGVFAVPIRTCHADRAEDFQRLIGARPSSYQAKRVLCGGLPTVQDVEKVDNYQALKPLELPQPNAPSHRLRLASPKEGTGALAHAAADLADGVVRVLLEGDLLAQHCRDPLLQLGIMGFSEQLNNLCVLHNDTPRFGNAYRAMMEELHIILAHTKPYSLEKFKDGALRQLKNRIDPILLAKLKSPEVHLATSGMNAVMQGLEVAKIAAGDLSVTLLSSEAHGETPLYFEVHELLNYIARKPSSNSKALLATLNNSVPEPSGPHQPWGVQAVVDATRAKVSAHVAGEAPFTLVLDITLELRGDLKKLTDELQHELVTGALQIVMCKSYQKFANLCSAKVMAGGVFIVGAESPARKTADLHLKAVEKDLDWMANDESQLMAHLIQAGHQEFNLLDRAVANAEFLRDTCFTGQGEHAGFDGYHAGLPFAMLSGHKAKDGFHYPSLVLRNAKGGSKSFGYRPTKNIDEDRALSRASFAFSETTVSHIPALRGYDPDMTRVALGQEGRAELTETFYMTSRMMLDGSVTGPLEARAHINKLIQAALTPEQQNATAKKPLAHKLAMVGANEAASLDDELRLTGNLDEMRKALESQNGQRGFTLNKIVSVISHLAHVTLEKDALSILAGGPDRLVIDHLLAGLIRSNMAGVSRVGREAVARFHAALCEADMESRDSSRRQQGVDQLIEGLSRMRLMHVRGAFVGLVTDTLFEAQPLAKRERLLDVLVQPMQREGRIAMIKRQIAKKQFSFAEACLDRLELDCGGRNQWINAFVERQRTALQNPLVLRPR